jgi:hypothetical protein
MLLDTWFAATLLIGKVTLLLHRFMTEAYQNAKKDNTKAYYFTVIASPVICCWIIGSWSLKHFAFMMRASYQCDL